MKINKLINELDRMNSNKEREDYLRAMLNNPLIGKTELNKIAATTLLETAFIKNYYRHGLKKRWYNEILRFYQKTVIYLKELVP